MPQRQSRAILLLSVLAGLWFSAGADAATWTADFDVSDERKTEVSGGDGSPIESPTSETIKKTYSVSYEIEANPALTFKVDLKLAETTEIKEGPKPDTDFDSYEIKPELNFDVTAEWWDFTSTWADTIKSSQDPGQDKAEDVTSDVELNMQPESDAAPDVKAKYKRDFNKEGGTVQKVDTSWEGSLDYTFWDLLDLSVDAQRTYSDEKIEADQDKEDRKIGFDASFDRSIGENLKIEAKWTNERSQSRTYLDSGDEKERTDTLKNTVEGKATYQPLESLELSVDKKIEWNSDLAAAGADVEVTDTLTSTIKYDQSLTETIDFSASYDDDRKDTRGNADSDAYEINRGYATSLDFTPLDNVTLSGSFDRTADLKWLDHPKTAAEAQAHKVDDKWEFKLDTSAWDDNVKLTVTRSLNTTTEDGNETTDQKKWDLDFELMFDSVPNLELSPKYTLTQDDDRMKETTARDKKLEVGLKYEIALNNVLSFTVDHTYGRTAKFPAEGKSTVVRDDNTDVGLSWTDFFEGMKVDISFTRKATDESKDDKGPVVDYTYKASYDWDILENYNFSFEYNFDRKQESQDTQSFKTSFSVDLLDGLLSLNLEHEFDEQLKDASGGETKDTHRYLIELQGKF